MKEMNATPSLGFVEAINASTSRLFQFTGRSRRSEYWWTMLAVFLISVFLTPVMGFFFDLATIPLKFRRLHDAGRNGWWWGFGVILKVGFVVSIVFSVIKAAVNGDRLEGHEGWPRIAFLAKYGIWLLVISAYNVLLLIFYCMDSKEEANEYGDSPKYQTVPDEEDSNAGTDRQ